MKIGTGKKGDRERRILMALVELYLEEGKPIGSKTLQESGLDDISSATIRNYFAQLEEKGFLEQPHTSGGRLPTMLALKTYAEEMVEQGIVSDEDVAYLQELRQETKEVAAYIHQVGEVLSEVSGCASFLSAPRFDQDFVLEMKLVRLDAGRCLCILLTDFGSVLTEVLQVDKRLSSFGLKRIEEYFSWRLTGQDQPEGLDAAEMEVAQRFYNEVMVRYITRYSAFSETEVSQSGFSQLLAYPEFHNPGALAGSLALFENGTRMRALLKDCEAAGDLSFWIGEETNDCSVVGIPYRIGGNIVGAIGLLGPTRLPYRKVFGLLRLVAEIVGETLSKSLHKFKIDYRQPEADAFYLPQQLKQLEDQRDV